MNDDFTELMPPLAILQNSLKEISTYMYMYILYINIKQGTHTNEGLYNYAKLNVIIIIIRICPNLHCVHVYVLTKE